MQQHLPVHLAGLYASSKQTCPLPSLPPITDHAAHPGPRSQPGFLHPRAWHDVSTACKVSLQGAAAAAAGGGDPQQRQGTHSCPLPPCTPPPGTDAQPCLWACPPIRTPTHLHACRLLAKLDFADMKFSLIFLGYQRPEDVPEDPGGWAGWLGGARADAEAAADPLSDVCRCGHVSRPAGCGCEDITQVLVPS